MFLTIALYSEKYRLFLRTRKDCFLHPTLRLFHNTSVFEYFIRTTITSSSLCHYIEVNSFIANNGYLFCLSCTFVINQQLRSFRFFYFVYFIIALDYIFIAKSKYCQPISSFTSPKLSSDNNIRNHPITIKKQVKIAQTYSLLIYLDIEFEVCVHVYRRDTSLLCDSFVDVY